MNDEIREQYMNAGAIAAEARDATIEKIKPGVKFLDIVCLVEDIIKKRGAKPAFPINISVNSIAAHFTPLDDDSHIFHEGDVVKIDVGVHVDGYIADTALTIEVGADEKSALIQASEEALNEALQLVKPGVSPLAIGKKVEKTIAKYKMKPIDNLTGHSLRRYNLHAGLSIPNVAAGRLQRKIHEDDVIAIEPFATNGGGRVFSRGNSNIYRLLHSTVNRGMREARTKLIFSKLYKEFKTLPFAYRWCSPILGNVDTALQRLEYHGLITHYPQLHEVHKGLVSQKEHTVIVTKEGCDVTTLGKTEQG